MRTSASSAPGTPASPPRAGCAKPASRSSSSRRATASAAASGRSTSPTARPVDRGGAWLAPYHDAIFALAGEVGVVDLQDVGEGRAPARRRRPHASLHRAHPEDQPARGAHDRAGAVRSSTGWRSRFRSTRRGPRSARRSGTRAPSPSYARALGDPHGDRPRPLRDGGARPVHRRPERHVVPPPAVPRARARQHQHPVLDREAARRRTWSTAAPARSRSASPTSSATRCA